MKLDHIKRGADRTMRGTPIRDVRCGKCGAGHDQATLHIRRIGGQPSWRCNGCTKRRRAEGRASR